MLKRCSFVKRRLMSTAAVPQIQQQPTGQRQSVSIQQKSTPRPRWRPGTKSEPFRLTETFLTKYASKRPPFGFNGLGEMVYYRTYSRTKENGQKEEWWETVARVVNGTYNMQKAWIEQHSLGWDKYKAQQSAQRMYDKIFNMKFLPPGRGTQLAHTSKIR